MFDQGDRVLVEDGPSFITGEIVGIVGVLIGQCWRNELIYAVTVVDGRALLVCERDLWPEHPRPVEPEPVEPDGCHDWARS